MTFERVWKGLLVLAVVLVCWVVLAELAIAPAPWTDDRATVEIVGEGGETKATVDAAVADTWRERHTGLSDHDSLARGEGMLFVHWWEGEQTYVMREMAFDIDIVFAGGDGEITTVHHARAPSPGEDGEDLRYAGEAKWVLEVPRGYANETGIEPGDDLEIHGAR